MNIKLFGHQLDALRRMMNGCILCGGVGSGKSITSIAYYYMQNGGSIYSLSGGDYVPMPGKPKDLYIITTARKRDDLEWDKELIPFLMSRDPEFSIYKDQKVVIDSWNNIGRYEKIKDAFFIFDEQRVVGSGKWVKTFIKIARGNEWILLSATPGDVWTDYIPVFIANGFYRSRTDFSDEHLLYDRFSKFPKITGYKNIGRMLKYKRQILVTMDFERETSGEHFYIDVSYDKEMYKRIGKDRWNPYTDEPIQNASGVCALWRRVVNSDPSRANAVLDIYKRHNKVIIFYSFNYELEILKNLYYGPDVTVTQWNGHTHEPVPTTDNWVYLVQYTAGCEGWNCITTDTIIFYSQSYSYKVMTQAAGRIDRLNTPFKRLYYYHLKSKSGIDNAISLALREKKNFNENRYADRILNR